MSLDSCVLDIKPKAVTLPWVVHLRNWTDSIFLSGCIASRQVGSLEEKLLEVSRSGKNHHPRSISEKMCVQNRCSKQSKGHFQGKLWQILLRIVFPPGSKRSLNGFQRNFGIPASHLENERPMVGYTHPEIEQWARINSPEWSILLLNRVVLVEFRTKTGSVIIRHGKSTDCSKIFSRSRDQSYRVARPTKCINHTYTKEIAKGSPPRQLRAQILKNLPLRT